MTLTADIGNSQIKLAIFSSDEPLYFHSDTAVDTCLLDNLYKTHNIDTTIISSVNKNLYETFTNYLTQTNIPYSTLTHKTPLPFKIQYSTPHTLGLDRISAMAGAVSEYGIDCPLLVIDAGTCITYDILIGGTFVGGNIAPGIKMRLTAMSNYTSALPKVESNHNVDEVGFSTTTALQAGAFWGTVYEINYYIQKYTNIYKTIKIILTGGDAPSLINHLQNNKNIFIQKYLVPKGLNFIANNTSK